VCFGLCREMSSSICSVGAVFNMDGIPPLPSTEQEEARIEQVGLLQVLFLVCADFVEDDCTDARVGGRARCRTAGARVSGSTA
jgi:hypothetical protein